MATSDVLRFTCSVENEFARNATKNFAGMLGKIFEDYQKLWNAYLKLQKHCEDAGIKIPCQLLESESDNNDVIMLPQPCVSCKESLNKNEGETSFETTKTFTPLRESVTNASNSDIVSNIEDSTLSEFSDENSLLRSPILAKKRSKYKKISNTQSYLILDDSEKDSSCITMKENISISANDSHQCIPKVSMEFKENECSLTENNNDTIECTPMSKMPRKLGVSTLYNVDTTLLQNGKKLKQTKLMFLPNGQSTDNTICEKRKPLKTLRPHISPTPEKNITDGSKGFSKATSLEEEIIQVSPAKHAKSNLKIKSLKLMRKSPTKFIERSDTFSKPNDNKTSDTKLPARKLDEISLTQCALPAYASTQRDEPCLISRSNTIASLSKISIGNDSIRPSSSPVTANSEHLFPQSLKYTSTPVQETKQLQMTENGSQVQKRKFSETVKQTNNSNSSVYNDETFFLLGECLKKEPISQTAEMKNTEIKTFENTSSDSPPAKRNLTNSFDIIPKKKDVYVKPPKNQSERAKMTGIACWECKQYYSNLGLPEEEIKARQNHCSRHRTILNQRSDTPEGLWHPLFSDTYTSTIQDDT